MFGKFNLSMILSSIGLSIGYPTKVESEPYGLIHDRGSSIYDRHIAARRKGQIRNAKPKPSGAAALKRAATKRNNIRKQGKKS
jgi:hypothetical protein